MTKKLCILTNQKIYLLFFLSTFIFNFFSIKTELLANSELQLEIINITREYGRFAYCYEDHLRREATQDQKINCQKLEAHLPEVAEKAGRAGLDFPIPSYYPQLLKQEINRRHQVGQNLRSTQQEEAGQAGSLASRQAGTGGGADCDAEGKNALEKREKGEEFTVTEDCEEHVKREIEKADASDQFEDCKRKSQSGLQHICTGSIFSQGLMEVLRAYKSGKDAGDFKAACESAKQLNQWALGVNATVLGLCMKALFSCVGSCNKAVKRLTALSGNGNSFSSSYERYFSGIIRAKEKAENLASECSSKRGFFLTAGGLQIARNMQAFLSSQKCEEQTTDNIASTPETPDITPTCDGLSGRALAECQSIPRTAPRGRRIAATPLEFTNSNRRNSLPKIRDPQFDPDDHLKGLGPEGEDQLIQAGRYEGNGDLPANSSSLLGGSSPGGGGGFGGGFPGGGTAAAPEEEGEEPFEEDLGPGIDTDILGDVIGSRAGISSLGGGSGSRTGGIGRFAEKFKNFKFPKLFDKKGKNKTNRSPAGTGQTNTITAANGLTNFQKVSRAMNKKRETTLR